MRKKYRVYLTLNADERQLLLRCLRSFRNKACARGIDTVDIYRIMEKIV